MSERFERLFSLQSQQYAPKSPVIIEAGALLKDTQTGQVLAQLKLKNISSKEIKAATISLLPLDIAMLPQSLSTLEYLSSTTLPLKMN